MNRKGCHRLLMWGLLFLIGIAPSCLQAEVFSSRDFRNIDTFPDFFNARSNQARFFNQGQFQRQFGNQFFNQDDAIDNFAFFNNNKNDLIIQRGGFEFFGDAKQIAGFNRILQRGNQLIGQTINGNQMALFIDNRGNLVDRTGRPVVNRDPEIVRQARTFFSQNRNKFQGGQLNSIDRFLSVSGGFSNGKMTIDLASLSLVESRGPNSDIPDGSTRIQAGLSALNFLLNTIQNRCLVRVYEGQVDKGSGTVSIDFSTFRDANGNLCFNGETLSLMASSDSKTRCNNGKIRINELINSMMQPERYNVAQGIAGLNRTQLSNVLGVQEDKLDTFGNKLLVGTSLDEGRKESGVVSGTQRVLERQNTFNIPGRSCYRSLDFKDLHETGAGTIARSVEESGILFSHEAEEWLCLGANGFMVTFLFDAAGTLLGEAPGSIASSPKLLRPAVRNVASCYDCHSEGFLGGSPRYTEQKGKIKVANQPLVGRIGPGGKALTHGDYFTTNNQYAAVAQQDSNLFVQAQKTSGSYLFDPETKKGVPLIPSSMEAHRDSVNPRVMARELGVTESTAIALLGNRAGISRGQFDAEFCQWKEASRNFAKAQADASRKSNSTKPEPNHSSRTVRDR